MSYSNPYEELSKSQQLLTQSLQQSSKLASSLLKSNQKQKQDYIKMELSIEKTIESFKKKFMECETNLEEIEIEYDKVKKFTNHGPGFLNAKL